MTRKTALTLLLVKAGFGASLALGFAASPAATARPIITADGPSVFGTLHTDDPGAKGSPQPYPVVQRPLTLCSTAIKGSFVCIGR
jgi:hypothetical protein